MCSFIPARMAFDPPENHIPTSEVAPYSEAAPDEVLEVSTRGARESMWPKAVIVFGLTLTIAWTALLAFGLIKLIDHAM